MSMQALNETVDKVRGLNGALARSRRLNEAVE